MGTIGVTIGVGHVTRAVGVHNTHAIDIFRRNGIATHIVESRGNRTRNILQAGDFTAAVGGQVQVGQLDIIGVGPLGVGVGTVLISICKGDHTFTMGDCGVGDIVIVRNHHVASVFHDRQSVRRRHGLGQTVHRIFRLHVADGEGVGNMDDNVLRDGTPFAASVGDRIGSLELKATNGGDRRVVIGQFQLIQRGAIVTDVNAGHRVQCSGGGVGLRDGISRAARHHDIGKRTGDFGLACVVNHHVGGRGIPAVGILIHH